MILLRSRTIHFLIFSVILLFLDVVKSFVVIRKEQQPTRTVESTTNFFRQRHSYHQQEHHHLYSSVDNNVPPPPLPEEKSNENKQQNKESSSVVPVGVRFLGSGENAIVRPGVVLIPPQHEYHHYYRNSAIFIFDMGSDPTYYNNEYMIRGVILDFPTPFTLYEMMNTNNDNDDIDNNDNQQQQEEEQIQKKGGSILTKTNPLGENIMFRGGDTGNGNSNIILLHNQPTIIGCSEQIGYSGIYQGGWDHAVQLCEQNITSRMNYKVFFHFCEFTEKQMEELLKSNEVDDDDINDAWCSVEVDSHMILSEDWERGDCWSRIRNILSQNRKQNKN